MFARKILTRCRADEAGQRVIDAQCAAHPRAGAARGAGGRRRGHARADRLVAREIADTAYFEATRRHIASLHSGIARADARIGEIRRKLLQPARERRAPDDRAARAG